MQLQAPHPLLAQAVNGPEAVRPRQDSERPPPEVVRGLNGARGGGMSAPAAVLHFGATALDLARGAKDDAESGARAELTPEEPGELEGSVRIDVSPMAGDPAATLRKMEIVQRAANAPANPSSADHRGAAEAARLSRQARALVAADRYGRAQALATT